MIWFRGRKLLSQETQSSTIAIVDLAGILNARPPERVPGTAIFLSKNIDLAPVALLHNLKHNKVLHAENVILGVRTANVPLVDPSQRSNERRIDANFTKILLTYGFMETPDIPRDLGLVEGARASRLDPIQISYFIGRTSLRASKHTGLPYWQDLLFIFMHRNESEPTEFFQIPPNRVVELGSQTVI